ncbi:MAG TPA: hypothetical protein VNJ07_07020, partial [Chitinophagales bacterium]|nr:hypothetical protein [Chitinophagales bacterium]
KTFQNDGVTDYIIVDTAAGNTTSYCTNRLCVMSDMVIVPTSLSVNDVLVTEQTLKDILPATKENPDLKIYLLPNRIHSLTSEETINSTLAHLNVPILPVFIPMKKSYTYTSTVRPAEGYTNVMNVILSLLEPESQPVREWEAADAPKEGPKHEVYDEQVMPVSEAVNAEVPPAGEIINGDFISSEPVKQVAEQT